MKEDLSFGTDVRGDEAIFVESKHFEKDMWEIDAELLNEYPPEPTFFRVIENGRETSSHGWINCDTGEVIQWG